MQKIAIFDIDGTFFRWQLYHELIFSLKDNGLFSPQVSADLEQALFDWKALKATWEDYEGKVVKVAETELNKINSQQLRHIAIETVNNKGHRVYNYTLNLADKLKQDGYYLLAISGSFQEIVEVFSAKYGFNDHIGMIAKKDHNGNFTKGYDRPIAGHKAELLQAYLNNHPNLTLDGSYGVGDSASDIDILKMVANPIAFNPNEPLLKSAKEHHWPIVIERKNIAYSLIYNNSNYVLNNHELY